MKLTTTTLKSETGGPPVIAYHRPGSSDEDAIAEVIYRHSYRRKKDGFDVEPGERWLDLGANIGAFALYCQIRGATADCYEPEPTCYEILLKNAARYTLVNSAVTDSLEPTLQFYASYNPENHYRNTIIPVRKYKPTGQFHNMHCGRLREAAAFDGIKMDIEGSEFALIDKWLLPRSRKLVMEYHISRDRSWENLRDRLVILRRHFKNVWTPKVMLDYVSREGDVEIRFDQLIFCWNEG